jgi:hypothetical protein
MDCLLERESIRVRLPKGVAASLSVSKVPQADGFWWMPAGTTGAAGTSSRRVAYPFDRLVNR